jgi:propionate CoA-transferase
MISAKLASLEKSYTGAPEAVLEALGKRYEATGSPNSLTLLFGGGPGDWKTRGLNHLGRSSTREGTPHMLRRTIGSHYGQVPQVADMALNEQVEAWTLPLGSISRMIRAQATHSPGHITNVGIGTYVDPNISGGAANDAAKSSTLHSKLVSRINIQGNDNLLYKALPIHVAIIRGTTADAQGNISIEHESLKCDQMMIAAAARNSGGIVIAQVKRLAALGSIPVRSVAIPGPLVDCVVVIPDNDHNTLHPMSYVEKANVSFTGTIKTPQDDIEKMPLDIRKIIARRAFFLLQPNTVVNLGIGLPEGVAGVASEEGMLNYVTLSTEPGVFGGLPASGHSFGPASNPEAIIEMNQMFDFYDGGGLNMAFLGAAEIAANGDVNVSRMSKNRLTGPGGFIDITQSTYNLCFLTPFTTKGLEVECPGDGNLVIKDEGKIRKFVTEVFEKTFSGEEAVRRGQTVFYVTERAVFRRTSQHSTIELIEIAPGIDLQKDILDQMAFAPAVSPSLKVMDERIFKDMKMGVLSEMFGSLKDRCTYHEKEHTLFIDLFGITIESEADINWLVNGLAAILAPHVQSKGPVDVVVNYDGFDIRQGLDHLFTHSVKEFLEKPYYKSVRRFAGKAFKRALLGNAMDLSKWDVQELYDKFDTDHNGSISRSELRDGLSRLFHVSISPSHMAQCFPLNSDGSVAVDRQSFASGILEVLRTK